ncbi:hypothetical protein I3842_01G095300 [Carya illinoinensis]|uniref:Uncharacterized protein n=1 Tax=Carya illinoinensis TaxID=32201 RepID=A0A922K9W2_CARIL|nr:hypothetical protein I3842_01G095300 [Carya illinoinensis]
MPRLSLCVDVTAVEVLQPVLLRPTGAIASSAKAMKLLLLRAKEPAEKKQERQNAISSTLEWAVLGKQRQKKKVIFYYHDLCLFLSSYSFLIFTFSISRIIFS